MVYIIHNIYIYIICIEFLYSHLLHGSSQCCGTLRSLAWAFPTSGGTFFSIMTIAKRIMAAQGTWIFLYHSASRPVTYQPQRIRLLCDVNIFGRLFLC